MFKLHPQLAADTHWVHESKSLLLLLADDARYPWVILVPLVVGVREVYELSEDARHELHERSAALGRELMALFNGDKLNVAALGNQVPQLHLHHVVRSTSDAAWPAPVWGVAQAVPYTPDDLASRMSALRTHLSFCREAS